MAAAETALFGQYWQRRETTREARERDTLSQIKACLRFCQRFLAAPTFSRDAWRRVEGWPRFDEDRSAKESQPTSSRTAEKRCGVIARFVSFAQVRFRIWRRNFEKRKNDYRVLTQFAFWRLRTDVRIRDISIWGHATLLSRNVHLDVLSIYESITLSNESPTRRLILSNVKTTEFRCLRWSLSS